LTTSQLETTDPPGKESETDYIVMAESYEEANRAVHHHDKGKMIQRLSSTTVGAKAGNRFGIFSGLTQNEISENWCAARYH